MHTSCDAREKKELQISATRMTVLVRELSSGQYDMGGGQEGGLSSFRIHLKLLKRLCRGTHGSGISDASSVDRHFMADNLNIGNHFHTKFPSSCRSSGSF